MEIWRLDKCHLAKEILFFLCKCCNWRFICSVFEDVEDNQETIEQTVLGIFAIKKDGSEPTDDLEDAEIIIEGVEVLHDLGNIVNVLTILFLFFYFLFYFVCFVCFVCFYTAEDAEHLFYSEVFLHGREHWYQRLHFTVFSNWKKGNM